MKYSFIIPIYNRPDELDELLNSLVSQTYEDTFEVVVIEDGSSIPSKEVCEKYNNDLSIFLNPTQDLGTLAITGCDTLNTIIF